MYIIKLGGSVITDKNKPLSVDNETIKKIGKALAGHKDMILVHGGGSFGHPLAKKYSLTSGYLDGKSVEGYSLTQHAMQKLNYIIVGALIECGLNAVSCQTSAVTLMEEGKIMSMSLSPVENMMELGLAPVMYGDVVTDQSKKRLGIASGDMIIEYLTRKMCVQKVFFISDTNGIYTVDPKKDPKAKLIPLITKKNIEEVKKALGGSSGIDVTGGMVHKVEHILKMTQRGITVEILKPENLSKALSGKPHESTVIAW